MTDKQAVIDALNRFPENASLEEITEELPILGAIRHGREDIAAGCSKSQAEAESLLESCAAEFRTVDLIVASSAETRGVDAFALSVIKAERQIRRLVTHLVYQFPSFAPDDIAGLRTALASNRRVYFAGFLQGFDALYPRSARSLVGLDYDHLRDSLNEATEYRNKIFHGQLTTKYLTRDDLLEYVRDIKSWCRALAVSALAEFEYDGFGRNSFQKSTVNDLHTRFMIQLTDVPSYANFIKQQMER